MQSQLVLMRHGQSVWNQRNLFTGWVDVPLSEEGIAESIAGGKKICDLPIDVAFTSTLIRAQMTLVLALLHHSSGKVPIFCHPKQGRFASWANICGEAAKQASLPVHIAWELNERMYGKLQGLNKVETAKQFGEEQVHHWRRSYDIAPPDGESLAMTVSRVLPYFKQKVVSHLEKGQNVLITAHGNSLRGIIMFLDGLSKEEVVQLEIATGSPLIFTYDRGRWEKTT